MVRQVETAFGSLFETRFGKIWEKMEKEGFLPSFFYFRGVFFIDVSEFLFDGTVRTKEKHNTVRVCFVTNIVNFEGGLWCHCKKVSTI
jgi:hypothetical protein